jgi:glycerol-3-phosphate acyltransferase PlsX
MIAIDVMGGDNAPVVVLQGAVAAARKGVAVQLHGPEEMITSWLTANALAWHDLPITIVSSQETIGMDEEPVFAVRKKPGASLVKAVESVARGGCTATLSAGNSGAMMAASALIIGRHAGIERPAIAGYLPTKHGVVLALDLGANTECRPHHLVQFAHLGTMHLREAKGIDNPRVGLLANGHEDSKGSALGKEAFALLKQEPGINFVGNVEPHHIFEHLVDIVVCDGFSGNVLLKTMEATTHLIKQWYPAIIPDLDSKLAHKQLGGALLLGVKGTAIVCHGNADAKTMEQAIMFAWDISQPSRAQYTKSSDTV